MRIILDIALNQLRITFGRRSTLISLIATPILIMLVIGGAFNDSGVPTNAIYDVVHHGDPLALSFVSQLQSQGSVQYNGQPLFTVCDLTQPTAQPAQCKLTDAPATTTDNYAAYLQKRLDSKVSQAAISLPDNFTTNLRAGTQVEINLNTSGAPDRVQQYIGAATTRLGGALSAARIVTTRLNGDSALFDKVYQAADSVWAKNPLQITETFSTTTKTAAGSGFGQSAPGIGAMFVLISALNLAEVFISERKNATLSRMLTQPLSRAQILSGLLLGQFIQALFVFLLMLVVGSLLGVQWGDPIGAVVVAIAYTLAVTGIGVLFATLVHTSGQAAGLRTMAAMVLAPLGGAWWPLSIVPAGLAALGRLSPIYWSQDAFSKMIFYGAKLGDVLPSIAVLLLFALVFFGLGLLRLRSDF